MIKYDIEDLKKRINIVDYVKLYIKLEQNGKNYVGLCPFHEENTPSFVVSEERQSCHCFGCGKTVDIIGFVQEYRKVSFNQALKILMSETGEFASSYRTPQLLETINAFEIKEKTSVNTKRYFLKESCFDGVTFEPVREWIKEGISKEVLEEHKVGYDKIANSICFPIYDSFGNIVAMKHRTLNKNYKEKKIPKYIYSVPIGVLDFFYWYHQNKEEIEKTGEIIIVEGEKSLMKLESWGYKNVVASMTSNLSQEQLTILLENQKIKNIVVAFDKDKSKGKIMNTFYSLKNYKNFYMVGDFKNKLHLLLGKDSPCDKGLEVWEKLYDSKELITRWKAY